MPRALHLPGGVTLVTGARVSAVWLDRPQVRNAQTFATWASLAEVARHLPQECEVVLLRSTGPDFSAGLDLRQLRPGGSDEGAAAELLAGDDEAVAATISTFQDAFRCWRALPAVVVAVVQGRAVGAGFQLALAADLRVLAADAQLTMAEVRLGLVPDLGGTARLVELVGYAVAMDLVLTARPLGAEEARQLGLATRVADAGELDGCANGLVEELLRVHPPASRSVKLLLAGAGRRTYEDQLAAERAAQAPLLRELAGLGSGGPPT